MVSTLHDQPERIERGYGSFLFKLMLDTDLDSTEYIQRPIWMSQYAPGFVIPGKRARKILELDALVSLPMFAKYSKTRIDQIPMNRLLFDLHEPFNRSHNKFLKDAMQTILDAEGLKE